MIQSVESYGLFAWIPCSTRDGVNFGLVAPISFGVEPTEVALLVKFHAAQELRTNSMVPRRPMKA